jgi:hypothetical protein
MTTEAVPYEKLAIPPEIQKHVEPGAILPLRLAAARGLVPVPPATQLGVCYLLSTDAEAAVREAALETLREMPSDIVAQAVSESTHSKVLELIATLRCDDPDIGPAIFGIRNANTRTLQLIASIARPEFCERIVFNHERLLITPEVYPALYDNPNCSDANLEKATSFLRLHNSLPQVDHPRPSVTERAAEAAAMDLAASVDAALRGEAPEGHRAPSEQLPMFDLGRLKADPLADFAFDFKDEASDFGWELTEEVEQITQDETVSLERKVATMPIGQRVRLAYIGNKEVRNLLVRDANKMVAVAVVKSGRCTDGEITSFASNRNLHDDVMREIAANPEYTRRYPVKVALVNNPKTPVTAGVAFVPFLQRKDMHDLCHNHNISSVVSQMARRLYRQKFQQG